MQRSMPEYKVLKQKAEYCSYFSIIIITVSKVCHGVRYGKIAQCY